MQAAIAADRRRVVDGAGNDGLALHKPGPRRLEGHGLKHWIEAAKKRLHRNVLAIALANKLARIAWSVLARRTSLRSQQASNRLIIHELPSYLATEVCERTRRDGGSVFPAHANTGDPNGAAEACPVMSSHAR